MQTNMKAHETFLYRIIQVIWYVFSVIEALLVVRVILELFGAHRSAPFTGIIYHLTNPLVAPFQYVFGLPSVGANVIDINALLALLVYWLIAWGAVSLVAMNRTVEPHEASHELRAHDPRM